MPASANERRLSARLAAQESWAQTTDRPGRTAAARAALLAKFEAEVDPNNELDPAERARRAEYKRKAYFTRLALKSAQARRAKRDAKRKASAAAEETSA